MFKKISKLAIISLGIFFIVGTSQAVQYPSAPTANTGNVPKSLERVKDVLSGHPSYDYETNGETLMQFIGQIINVFLGIMGSIFIFLIVYAGYLWMTAGGDEKKVEKGQQTLKYAIIGLIIVAGSYAIWQFLFIRLLSR